MFCRIIKDDNEEIVGVLAPNGEPSQLFADIMVDTQDTNEALSIYRQANEYEDGILLDDNREPVWETIRQGFLEFKPSNSSIVDTDLLTALVDNGNLKCG